MSTMHGGCHLGWVSTHTHTRTHEHTLSLLLFSVGFQNAVGRWDGLPDARLVWLGKHVLRHWFHVWTVGTRSLAVFLKRYSRRTVISINTSSY